MGWLSRLFSSSDAVSITGEQRRRLDEWLARPMSDLGQPHRDCRYVVVDVESSGLDMRKDSLISIGAVAVNAGLLDFTDSFQVVLRQETVSTSANVLIHGIGHEAQSSGVEPAEALLAFLEYIGRAPLVAYHAFFDQSMIAKAMRRYLGHEPELVWIDLAWVLPDFFPFRDGLRIPLDDWLERFSIENILRHNAVSDAYATAKLLQVAIAAGGRKSADTPADFMKIEKARRWMYESR